MDGPLEVSYSTIPHQTRKWLRIFFVRTDGAFKEDAHEASKLSKCWRTLVLWVPAKRSDFCDCLVLAMQGPKTTVDTILSSM